MVWEMKNKRIFFFSENNPKETIQDTKEKRKKNLIQNGKYC